MICCRLMMPLRFSPLFTCCRGWLMSSLMKWCCWISVLLPEKQKMQIIFQSKLLTFRHAIEKQWFPLNMQQNGFRFPPPPSSPRSCEWRNAEGRNVGCPFNVTVLKNIFKEIWLFASLLPIPTHALLLISSSPSSEWDAGQSAVDSSFRKISQPLSDQPREPQPTQGKSKI